MSEAGAAVDAIGGSFHLLGCRRDISCVKYFCPQVCAFRAASSGQPLVGGKAIVVVVWLQRCAEEPRLKLFFAEAVNLAACEFAACGGENLVEDSAADLFYCLFALDDRAAVDVHVVGHAVVDWGVGGDLDRRRRLAAVDRAAAGGEADEVGSGGDLTGGGDGIEAG